MTRTRFQTVLTALLLAQVLQGLPLPLRAESKAGRTLEDAWFDFFFQKRKVGFLRAIDEETNHHGAPALHAHRWSVLTVLRQSESIRMESTTDAWFSPEGTPFRFKHERKEGSQTRSTEGYREGKEFVLRVDVGGNLSEQRIALADDVYLSSSLEVLFHRRLAPKAKLRGKAIVEEEGQVRPFELAVTATEQRNGRKFYVVEGDIGGLRTRELVAEDGKSERVEVLGLGAEFVRTTKEEALRLSEPVDIFSAALFSVPKPLPPGNRLDRLSVRIRGKSGARPPYLADERQAAKPEGRDAVVLSIAASVSPRRPPALPVPGQPAFLRETPYEALQDDKLRQTAKRVTTGAKDAWDAARRINGFVYGHIENKSLARAFSTAREALDAREGDCTEHAVLFSALAKIVGIPTRLATGLVYVGGQKNIFGYHEWVEVWMGSGWVAMDPTFGQDLADPTHVKFTHGMSDPDGLRDAGLVAATLIGDLELEVVEYLDDNGKRVRP